MIAAVAAVVAAAVLVQINQTGVRAIAAPASIGLDTLTGALVRSLTLSSAIVHRAVHRYARVLITDNDKADADEDLIRRLTEVEEVYQVEYARKAADRVARKVFVSMMNEYARQEKRWDINSPGGRAGIDEAVRKAYRQAVVTAASVEEKYFDMRMEGVRQRITETVDEMRLKTDSPEGAYWLIDPSRKTHTPGCVAMANKAWSWAVLKTISPAMMHYGCGCKIISLDLAAAGNFPHWRTIGTVAPSIALAERIR
jgi:hypothetical protein